MRVSLAGSASRSLPLNYAITITGALRIGVDICADHLSGTIQAADGSEKEIASISGTAHGMATDESLAPASPRIEKLPLYFVVSNGMIAQSTAYPAL